MFKLHNCLTEKECKETLQKVHALKDHWKSRMGKGFPFFTLGTASYLDAGDKGEVYYKLKAKDTNALLKENFPSLYDRVMESLIKATGKKVEYEDQLALPGFHIFQYCEMFNYPIASEHFDLQFKEMFWGYRNVEYDNPITFTLTIRLPSGGGGLNYWDIFYTDVEELSNTELKDLRDETEKKYFEYQEGKMIVHGGLMLHQIAPAKDMKPDDERITLQGHGLICDNILRVYW